MKDVANADTQQTKMLITLVHGTQLLPRWLCNFFRFKAVPWADPKSSFAQALKDRLAKIGTFAEIAQFTWSGANSIRHRDLAGKGLADYLKAQHQQRPDATKVIIGHSHAGNIALRCLHYLRGEVPNLKIVTIATPFLEIFPAVASGRVLLAYQIGCITLFFPLWTAFILGISDYVNPFIESLGQNAVVVVLGFAALIGLLAWALMIALRKVIHGNERSWLAAISSHQWRWKANERILVLRGVDDEATMALVAGAIATRLTGLAMGLLAVFSVLAIGILGLFGFAMQFSKQAGAAFAYVIYTLQGRGLVWPIVLAPAAMYGVVLLAALCKSVNGRELFFGFAHYQVSVHSSPDAARNVTTITLEKAFPGMMRHSLYQNPACVSAIVKWLGQL